MDGGDLRVGLSGDTVAIHGGKLYVSNQPRQVATPESYWARSVMDAYPWPEAAEAQDLFAQGKFEIVRKPADLVLALRHLVYDNACQPADTTAFPTRWSVENGWQTDPSSPRQFRLAEAAPALSWLRYRHRLPGSSKPELVTDLIGYNSSEMFMDSSNWVGDLMLECTPAIDKPEGELRLQLCQGVDRFDARFDLASGMCRLVRSNSQGETEIAQFSTRVKQAGSYRLRFANASGTLLLPGRQQPGKCRQRELGPK